MVPRLAQIARGAVRQRGMRLQDVLRQHHQRACALSRLTAYAFPVPFDLLLRGGFGL